MNCGEQNWHEQRYQPRTGRDRRSTDRRAPWRIVDTLFAASLLNQAKPAHAAPAQTYATRYTPRCGMLADQRT